MTPTPRPTTIDAIDARGLEQVPSLINGLDFFRQWGADGHAICHQLAAAPEHDVILAATDERGQLLGFCWVMPKGAFGRSAYLRLLAIHNDHRRSGLGRALMARCEQLTLSPNGLCMLVTSTNTAARQFYERLGYQQVGLLPSYVKPGIDECLYLKQPTSFTT